MKRAVQLTIFIAAMTAFVSCADKHENTIINLQMAITGETNASAAYQAFAEKAAAEGHRNIANMFRAAAAAENLHVRNHNDILKGLGEAEFKPAATKPNVGSTEENLRAAIAGETEEYTAMYPGFISAAKKEKCKHANDSFNLAMNAEENHAILFSEALSILTNPAGESKVPSVIFVCEQCGGMLTNSFTKCLLCKADSELQNYVPIVFDADPKAKGK